MADENQIIGATIQVDTGNSGANVKGLKTDINELKQGLNETGATAKKTGKDIDGTSGNFTKLKGSISDLPGPLGAAGEGVSTLNKTFKALLANPIVLIITAIVGALTILYKAFTSTNAGGEKVEQIFAGLGAVVDIVRDRILKFAGAIVKVLEGDFVGAVSDAKAAVSGFGAEVASEFRQAANAARELQEIEDVVRELGVSRAKLDRDLAQTKEIITDENATLAEKKKAIDAVRIAEGKQTEQELANAKRKLNAIRQLNSLSDTSDEDLQKEADAQAAVYQLEAKSANDIRSLNKQERLIEREAAAKAKEARSAAIAAQKEERQKLVEFTNNLIKIQQENELLTIKDGYEKEKKELENKIADAKRQNELALKDRKVTADQFRKLQDALDIQADLQRSALAEKNNKEVLEKEEAFQKELNSIRTKIQLEGISDSRQLERTQLKIGYEEKLNDAIKQYADDQAKFAEVKSLLDEQQRIQQQKLDEKFQLEDDQKAFKKKEQELKDIIDEKNADFEGKRAALDAEQILIQDAFDRKLIAEEEYNVKIKGLAQSRMDIAELETQHKKAQVNEVASVLTALTDLVGKQTIAGKALGVATALINTYQGASEAIKQKSTLPSPFDVIAKVANVAAIIGMGLKTAKSIVAVKVPGGGGGGSVPSADSATPAPIAPVQQSTRLDASTINNIGNAASGGTNREPIRAFVLDSDSQNNRERNERLNRAARLGG